MALTPSRNDRNRRRELKRKKSDPESFNAAEVPRGAELAGSRTPDGGEARNGMVRHRQILERSRQTGESYKDIERRNHRKPPGDPIE